MSETIDRTVSDPLAVCRAAPPPGADRPPQYAICAILFVILAIWKGETFYGQTNLLEILDQQSATLIIAAAGTMVLIGGGIDLSVGATYALCQVIAMKMAISGSPVLAILVGVIIGIGVGAANGVITTFFRINSLIATLATSFVITGAAALITGGNLITNFAVTGYASFARTQFLDVTTAALGGIIDSSRVLSASSANGGTALTFTVLAGIVVGGTSILGGEGAIWRTVVGVLFIAMIGNGFTLLGWNPLYEQITLGVILLLAVGGDAWSRLRTG
jgi:ribose transport system permease protein